MKIAMVILFLLIQSSVITAQNFLEIDNDTIHLKLDLSRGGAIAYLSESRSERNLINVHDEGRYVQQSYYAGKNLNRQKEGQSPQWSPWPWNPIQVGDMFFNSAKILKSNIKHNTVYTKCIPMLWDMNNKPAEATIEQWTTVEANILKVRNRLTCNRTDTIYGEDVERDQELPAVYPISALSELYTYNGEKPFTNDSIEELEVKNLEKNGFWGRYLTITENWMAFVDNDNWGIAVYTPSTEKFLAGMAGKPGGEAHDGSTSYIAPIKKIKLGKKTVYEYEYYLLVGTLADMRRGIYEIHKRLPKNK